MPFTSRRDAKDAIFNVIKPVLDAAITATTLDRVYWSPTAQDRPTSGNISWALVDLVHISGEIANINGLSSNGTRRYMRTALLTIQIYEPSGFGRKIGDELGEQLENVMQGKVDPEALIFRSVFTSEAQTQRPWDISSVSATVIYNVFE